MKRIICLLLATFLLFSLTACGKDTPADKDQTPDENISADGNVPGGEENKDQPNSGEETPDNNENAEENPPKDPEPATKILYFCTEEKVSYSDGGGSVITRTYDEKGNLLTDFYRSNDGLAGYGSSFTYDENGNKLSYKAYDNHSKVSGETTYTYNDAGQLISQSDNSNDAEPVKSDYTYREDGLLVEKINSYPNNPASQFRFVYSYDEKGNLIREDWINVYNGEETPHSWTAWTYDATSNKLSKTDNRGFKTEWTYDTRGNMLSETNIDEYGAVDVGVVYTYDEQNRLLTEGWFKGDVVAIMETYVYEYDESGKKIARYTCNDSTDKSTARHIIKYTYDEFGNLLKATGCTPSGTETSWREYKYIAIELPNEQKEN